MPRASNSGGPAGFIRISWPSITTVASVIEASPAPCRLELAADGLVDYHADDDHDSDEHVEIEPRQPRQDDDVLDQLQHAGAEHDADHRAAPAEQRQAADHADGDREQLDEELRVGHRGVEPSHAEDSGGR